MKPILALPKLLIIGGILLSLFSCKKDLTEKIAVQDSQGKDGPIPPYVFAWDNPATTYMPTNPANQIPMPWNAGTTAINPYIVSDYLSSNGWQLVYNTFSPTTPATGSATPYFFALYNIYRGILRFYLWQPPTAVASSYVNHGLSLYTSGPTSPMLNFDAVDLVDGGTNQTTFNEIDNQAVNASGGTWYAFQYQIAYDPNVAATSFPNLGLTWNSQFVNVTSFTATGDNIGTIDGTISLPDQNNVATALGDAVAGTIEAFGVVSTGGAFQSAIGNALGNDISGFFSAIAGGSNSPQEVDLSINSTITLNGTLVSPGGLENMKLPLPGQSNSQTANGIIPYYNTIMGLFNIVGRPTVTTSTYSLLNQNGIIRATDYYTSYVSVDNRTFSIQWNPAIVNSSATGVTIQNIKEQIIAYAPLAIPSYTIGLSPLSLYHISVYSESIGNYNGVYSGVFFPYQAGVVITDQFPVEIEAPTAPAYRNGIDTFKPAVRITFDVVPNNGTTPKSHITKTLIANSINN